MSEEKKDAAIKWYYKPVWVIVAILALGPLALPIVWLSPAINKWLKVFLTVVTIIVTVWLVQATIGIYHNLLKQMADMQNIMQ